MSSIGMLASKTIHSLAAAGGVLLGTTAATYVLGRNTPLLIVGGSIAALTGVAAYNLDLGMAENQNQNQNFAANAEAGMAPPATFYDVTRPLIMGALNY